MGGRGRVAVLGEEALPGRVQVSPACPDLLLALHT